MGTNGGIENNEPGTPDNGSGNVYSLAVGNLANFRGESADDLFANFESRRSRSTTDTGTGNADSDGNTSSRRTRTRKTETAETFQPIPVEKRTRARRKTASKTGITAKDIGVAISGLASLIALVRGSHWIVSADDAESCLGEPLIQLIEKLPASTEKQIGSLLLPSMILSGGAILFAPAIQEEIRKIDNAKHSRNSQKSVRSQTGSNPLQGENSVGERAQPLNYKQSRIGLSEPDENNFVDLTR